MWTVAIVVIAVMAVLGFIATLFRLRRQRAERADQQQLALDRATLQRQVDSVKAGVERLSDDE